MHNRLDRGRLGGEALSLPQYRSDFSARQWEIGGHDSWKLERAQHFREPGVPSWEAFARGDWEESLRLIEAERDHLTEFANRARALDIGLYRVRVVEVTDQEPPIVPYLQWELNLLKLRVECGERIRVVSPDQIADYETGGNPLPELVTLGRSVLYEVLYDDMGELTGAIRVIDASAIAAASDLVGSLYERGEEFGAFFERAVAPLPAPPGESAYSR